MASFRKRSGRWQARVSRRGFPDAVKTFATREDAQKWARSVERQFDVGDFLPQQRSSSLTLRDLIERYRSEVVPKLRGASTEHVRLSTIARLLGHHQATALAPNAVAQYRDIRLKSVTPSTCLRELQTLSALLTVALREWQVIDGNAVAGVKKPSANRPRDRRLERAEEARLLQALTPAQRQPDGRWSRGIRNPWLKPLFELALQTAMRRGELLSLRWQHVHLEKSTAFLPETKNGHPRAVPLSPAAVALLAGLPRSIDGRVFPLSANAVRQAWNRARLRADLPDLHLHDLRHEATSRLAERLNVLELAAVTGHRDLTCLKRYHHPRAEDLARKLG